MPTWKFGRNAVLVSRNRLRVLAALLDAYAAGRPISFRKLTAGVGLSTAGVLIHLRKLRRDGLIAWEEGKSGTLRPTCRVYLPDS